MEHKKQIEYEGGLEKLVQDLGDLHYLSLQKFLELLSHKIMTDARADEDRQRPKLASALSRTGLGLKNASVDIKDAWEISKPYMKE